MAAQGTSEPTAARQDLPVNVGDVKAAAGGHLDNLLSDPRQKS